MILVRAARYAAKTLLPGICMVVAGGETRASSRAISEEKCMFYASAASAAVRRLMTASATVISAAAVSASGASAQTRPPNFPTQSVEMIAPAATVTSTVHYQAMVTLTCNAGFCTGNFDPVRRKHQLHITRVWCDLGASSSWSYSDLYLFDRNDNLLLQQGLPLSASNPTSGFYQSNRAVDLQVDAGQMVTTVVAFSGAASFGTCTVAGTLSTLQ
jgi:hypothetical protein